MFSVFRTLSLRHLQKHWFRCVLIVASIALGVATLVATRLLNETMSQAVLANSNPMAGVVDFVVSNGAKFTVPRAMAAELAQVPGVKSVQPRIFSNAILPDFDKKNVLVLGIDMLGVLRDFNDPKKAAEISLGPGTIETYALYEATKKLPDWLRQIPVIVGKALADELPSGTLRIRVQRDPREQGQNLAYAGFLEAKGDAAALGGYVLILDLINAAELLGLKSDQVHRLDVALAEGAKAETVRAELVKRIGDRARLSTPAEHNQAKQSAMAGMQTGFSLCGLAALIVGVFLVYNTLAVGVAERRHEIGILLSLGATRVQVRRLFAVEAALLGLTGSLLGLPLGVWLASLGLAPMQDILREVYGPMHADRVATSLQLMGVAVAAGFLTAVLAALVPAIQASRENPAEAVRRVEKTPTRHRLAAHVAACLALMLTGVVFVLMRRHLPSRIGTYGGLMLVLIGGLVASPFLAAVFARLIRPLVRGSMGIEWRLAADNLVRSPGRTGLVIGALAAGVSLVVQTAGTIVSNRLALRQWVEETISADLVLTAGGPISAGQLLDMEESLGDELRALPMVAHALPLRQVHEVPYKDTTICLLSLDARATFEQNKAKLKKTRDNDLYRKLDETANGVIVSENFAALNGVKKGDVLQVGGQSLTVLGDIVDYTWNHGTLILNRRDYKKHWKDNKVSVWDVYLTDGTDPLEAKQIINQKLGAQHQLHALTRTELQTHIDDMIERLYGIAYGQQVVVMLVATLGVIAALLISVLQRRREMGLLRAIGASRLQVIHSVLAEACLMGIIGTLIGILVGIPLQWYVLQIVILEESGYLFPMYIPWQGALVIAAAALTTATLAGLGPAVYAVRQRIPEAIAYE